jgi:protein-tyrosine phosphatase
MKSSNFIADIHTHILPEMDDGAASVNESVKLLCEEERQGITDVVLTPHYNISEETVGQFLSRRQRSYEMLCEKIAETGMAAKLGLSLGAEVRYDPNLIKSDAYKLCFENTSYILLEPTGSYPFNFENTLYWFLAQGITPIIAHVERYSYIYENRSFMEEILSDGIVFQSNAGSLFSHHYGGVVKKLIKHGYVSVLASDAHNLNKRPPMLADALKKVKKHSPNLIDSSVRIIKDMSL